MRLRLVCMVVLSTLWVSSALAQDNPYLSGVVSAVGDGDTIKVTVAGNPDPVEVRFSGVDSPEKAWTGHWGKQPFSDEATAWVKSQIDGKKVTVLLSGDQTFGRVVGEVFYQGRSINRELVREGFAWWNKKYARGDHDLSELQEAAKTANKGLWNQASPSYTATHPFVPPWEWRHENMGLGN